MATRVEKSDREFLEKSLNAEGNQGPLFDEHTERTGEGNTPIPSGQEFRQRRDQQFGGLEEYDYQIDPTTGWRYYLSSRTTHSSSSSYGNQAVIGSQLGAGIRGKH